MSDEISSRLQQTLISIVEGFSDYFIEKIEAKYSKTPEFVNVVNIRVEKKLGATGIRLVKVQLETNFGIDEESLAVKIYSDKNDALQVTKNISIVENRLSPFLKLGISSPGVIFFSGPIIVMEGLAGDSFRESKIPRPEKYRLAGKCLAALHSYNKNQVWFEKYQLLLSKAVDNLPIEEKDRGVISEMFAKPTLEVSSICNNSGSITFGDFHPGNVIFDIRIGKNPVLWTYLIDPEFLDKETSHDRLEDICNFFAVEIVDCYRRDPSLKKMKMNLRSFLSGYNEILAINNSTLVDYYEGDYLPINYFMSIMVLLSILNLLNMPELFPTKESVDNEIKMRLELIKRLLDDKRFPYDF